MIFMSQPASGPLSGSIRVPGDKSLSHRAVLFAAMAEGTSNLAGVLDSADVRSTLAAVEALGAGVQILAQTPDGLAVRVRGWGDGGPTAPSHAIDCGNSGTTARLLLGVLAGWPITVTLEGDRSLSSRPMGRVTKPLQAMGAEFLSRDGLLPITVHGGSLHPVEYGSPVGSAQVKTAVLLAGLRATGVTEVAEPAPSRDHTERLLPAFGVAVETDPERHAAWVTGPLVPQATDVAVPADPSSAAFFAVAALLVPGSSLQLGEVGLNPTRTGFLRVLERMGAQIETSATTSSGAEPIGTLTVRASKLRATRVDPAEVPSLVDEIPILALAAACAEGETRFDGVAELRVKESDRLAAIVEGLRALGVDAGGDADSLTVKGAASLGSARLDSLGDHRLAMTWAVSGLVASAPVEIERFEAVEVSYPGFAHDLERVRT